MSVLIQELKGNQKPRGFAKKNMKIEVAQDAIVEAYKLEKQAGEFLLKADEHKEKAWRYMQTFNHKHLDVELTDVTVRLQVTSRNTIKYDERKLKKVLPKEVFNEVLIKNYEVTDIETLKSVMKEYGVPANILKACLKVTQSIDKKRMDDMYDHDIITVEQIKGCYTLTETKSLKLKEIYK